MRMWATAIAVAGAVLFPGTAMADVEPGSPCTPFKAVYSEKNWERAHPANGAQVCNGGTRRGHQNTKRHFYEYRHYRQITPYRCLDGREGTFAIPCYIIACESRFNWWAQNPSGAKWIYQLLGWGAPAPSSFHNRLVNHEIAAGLSLSNWACA